MLCDVLSAGRTSRLVKELVLQGRLLSASAVAAYPGERHAGLLLLYAVPKEGGFELDGSGGQRRRMRWRGC